MKALFLTALLSGLAWFGRELWPYVKVWLDDRKIRQRKEQLRLERERDGDRATDE